MTDRAYTVDTTAAFARYLADTVRPAGGTVEITSDNGQYVVAQIDVTAYAVLTGLPEDSDGHVDSEGRMWVDGASDQLTPINL